MNISDSELLLARNVLDTLFFDTTAPIDSEAIIALDAAIDLLDGILLERKAR